MWYEVKKNQWGENKSNKGIFTLFISAKEQKFLGSLLLSMSDYLVAKTAAMGKIIQLKKKKLDDYSVKKQKIAGGW